MCVSPAPGMGVTSSPELFPVKWQRLYLLCFAVRICCSVWAGSVSFHMRIKLLCEHTVCYSTGPDAVKSAPWFGRILGIHPLSSGTLSISWKAFWNGKMMVRRLLLRVMVCWLHCLVGIEKMNTRRGKTLQDFLGTTRNTDLQHRRTKRLVFTEGRQKTIPQGGLDKWLVSKLAL